MSVRTRVKFCGITRHADALAAVELGVDALGFVFYESSPRWIAPTAARAICDALPPFVCTVGLFVDASPEYVSRVVAATGIDLVQFHGEETPETCRAAARPYIKAIRVQSGRDFSAACDRYPDARAILVDAYHPELPGGTGTSFDWELIPVMRSKPIILAGGLSARNLRPAIRQVRPYAVDVSGGIESAKGIKDAAEMRAFMAEVNSIERDP